MEFTSVPHKSNNVFRATLKSTAGKRAKSVWGRRKDVNSKVQRYNTRQADLNTRRV